MIQAYLSKEVLNSYFVIQCHYSLLMMNYHDLNWLIRPTHQAFDLKIRSGQVCPRPPWISMLGSLFCMHCPFFLLQNQKLLFIWKKQDYSHCPKIIIGKIASSNNPIFSSTYNFFCRWSHTSKLGNKFQESRLSCLLS